MRSRELQKILVTLTGRPAGDIDTRTRVLRLLNNSGGMISSGPRGPAAPHMTAIEWAWHLLALVARRVPETDEVINRLVTCVHHKDDDTSALFESREGTISLVAVIAYAIEHSLNWLGNVEIDEDGRCAWANVHRADAAGKVGRMFFTTDPAVNGEMADATAIGNRFVLGGAAIMMLHKMFTEDAAAADEQLKKAG